MDDVNEINSQMVHEARRWMVENKGLKTTAADYNSPRVSSEIGDCSMPMTFDHLNFCSLGCLYCFAYFFKTNNPVIKDMGLRSVNVPRMIANMQGKGKGNGALFYEHFYSRKFLLHWGGLADPFCNFERANNVGLQLINALGEMNYPTLFSFKGSTIFEPEYVSVFEKYASQQNFAFQVSIVSNSDRVAHVLEIGAPSTTKRLAALKLLSDMGYYTILRLRPFILGVTDEGLEELLGRALEAGIKGVSTEFFAMDARANEHMKERYVWLAKLMGIKDLMAYFKRTSPPERGGYRRMNRLIKEPYIRTIYDFCVKNGIVCGISDPDFKELNTSGSCCGMPDNFPANRGLENWTRAQLTFHLKEARKKYHSTGELTEFLFEDIYTGESYLDCKGFANEHVCVVGMPTMMRKELTQKLILQGQWNNLRSPANPYNYFHGKMAPCGLDSAGNLKFKYVPMEYEERWTADGINLKK